MVLRSQAQAEYAAENYGHFGLNLRRYAHFTSPIRRYADLVVHRALIRALKLGNDGLPGDADQAALAEIGARISATERRAMAAERETVDRLIAHFLADRIGATFEGRIAASPAPACSSSSTRPAPTASSRRAPSATNISATTRRSHALIGDRTGETYRLGDRVTVRLVEAAPVAGALRFELLSGGRVETGRPARAPSAPRGPRRRSRRPRRAQQRGKKRR